MSMILIALILALLLPFLVFYTEVTLMGMVYRRKEKKRIRLFMDKLEALHKVIHGSGDINTLEQCYTEIEKEIFQDPW